MSLKEQMINEYCTGIYQNFRTEQLVRELSRAAFSGKLFLVYFASLNKKKKESENSDLQMLNRVVNKKYRAELYWLITKFCKKNNYGHYKYTKEKVQDLKSDLEGCERSNFCIMGDFEGQPTHKFVFTLLPFVDEESSSEEDEDERKKE
jgi:hypothetical protein